MINMVETGYLQLLQQKREVRLHVTFFIVTCDNYSNIIEIMSRRLKFRWVGSHQLFFGCHDFIVIRYVYLLPCLCISTLSCLKTEETRKNTLET